MKKLLKIFKPHRLRIIEQVIIVSLCSLIIPLVVTGIIVNNINRQALARQLGQTAMTLAQTVDNNIYNMFEADDTKIKEIASAVKFLSDKAKTEEYLKTCVKNSPVFSDLQTVEIKNTDLPVYIKQHPYLNPENGDFIVSEKIGDNKYLIGTMKKDYVDEQVFRNINENVREIFVFSNTDNLIFSLNYNEKDYNFIKSILPKNIQNGFSFYIGDKENQPIVYRKMNWADVSIVVNTTEEITEKTIYTSAWKILTAMLVSTLSSILFMILYTSYLYINIRQLFKGIIALSKGNYSRKIRLLKNVLTPFELVFLALEFNKAADEINASYSKLEKQNKELERLDNFRSNLIDTVSHEFRTPLTSIKGYTSRLLRNDIKIDEATFNKSLKVIKQQCERLSRMVEDLLVIPDIEGEKISMNYESVNVSEALELSLLSVKNIENREVLTNIQDSEINVIADKDRFEQVLINLIENANKYGEEDTALEIEVKKAKDKVAIIMKNKAEYIEKETLSRLFEKFVRLDDKMTRTTRGTGLGLYIVKGLIEAMNGHIYLRSTKNNDFITYIVLPSEEM